MTVAAQTPQASVIIDGCALPIAIYELVKQKARETRKTQFVGVEYLGSPLNSISLNNHNIDWDAVEANNRAWRADVRAGVSLAYTIGKDRAQLQTIPGLLMILWITPYDDQRVD